MFKFIKKEYISYVLVLCFGLFMSAMAANAASTISTNISTGGTLTVSTSATVGTTLGVTGLSSLGQATSTMLSAYTAYFGASATSTFSSTGALSLAGALTGTSATFTGAVNTATASTTGLVTMDSFTAGSGSTVSKILFGTCTPTVAGIPASTTISVICTNTGGTEVVNSTDYKVFVTPFITEDRNISLVSASSTALGIQVTLLNRNITGAGTVDPTEHPWSWMAIK